MKSSKWNRIDNRNLSFEGEGSCDGSKKNYKVIIMTLFNRWRACQCLQIALLKSDAGYSIIFTSNLNSQWNHPPTWTHSLSIKFRSVKWTCSVETSYTVLGSLGIITSIRDYNQWNMLNPTLITNRNPWSTLNQVVIPE